ncbi:MAG: glycoside hydrolase family 43 protein [Bacteroidota bacterium]
MKTAPAILTFVSFLLFISSSQMAHSQPTGKNKDVWMLTYFRQRYPTRIEINEKGEVVEVPLPDPFLVAQLHIALSADGRNWTPLNNNKPIWDHFVRDQFIHRGTDGLWRLVATGGSPDKEDRKTLGPSCLYATSKDLVHWEVDQYLFPMKNIRNAAGDMVRNIWAPEFFYEDSTKEYTLFWSSSFKDAGWKESQLWYCKTKDWKTFTPAQVMFAPPYSVIDGTLIKQSGTYYLFHKEEEFGVKTGERRGIRVATSKNINGPYKIYEGPLNKGQIAPVITEGPSVMKDPIKKGWLLLYDYPMADKYGISTSADLMRWNVDTNINFPADARHGSISKLTAEEAKRLRVAFPNTSK